MKPISTDLENIFQPVQLREDEYLNGETNLISCSRCRTPRQKRFEMTGKLFEPRCMCACQTAAYEQREQERKHREFLDTVARNRSVGLPDPELRKHTFEHDLGYNPKQMNMAKCFGKGAGTTIALILFPGITSLVLGLGKAEFRK